MVPASAHCTAVWGSSTTVDLGGPTQTAQQKRRRRRQRRGQLAAVAISAPTVLAAPSVSALAQGMFQAGSASFQLLPLLTTSGGAHARFAESVDNLVILSNVVGRKTEGLSSSC